MLTDSYTPPDGSQTSGLNAIPSSTGVLHIRSLQRQFVKMKALPTLSILRDQFLLTVFSPSCMLKSGTIWLVVKSL